MASMEQEQCSQLQDDELAVLESIYPTLLTTHPNPHGKSGRLITLALPITLPGPTPAHLSSTFTPRQSAADTPTGTLTLDHLPPLVLRVLLPPSYPLSAPPHPVSLRAPLPESNAETSQGNWLPKSVLKSFDSMLGPMWREEKEAMGEGQGVLWKWMEWIVSGDCLVDSGKIVDGVLNLSVPPTTTSPAFLASLKSYDATQKHSEFEKTAFSCSICWENRKGAKCVQLGCGCIFCTQCLSDCWTLAITEGTLESVACPSPPCVKQRALRDKMDSSSDVPPDLLENVVGPELKDRWATLKERRMAEIDPSYTVCPRPTCQAAVPPPSLPDTPISAAPASSSRVIRLADISSNPPPSEPARTEAPIAKEDRWAAYRSCPKCHFSFCLYCASTWHGPHTACSFPQVSGIVKEYLSYPEGSMERARIEKQKGKANIDRLVRQWQEDEMNRQWLEGRTRACAGCGVRVEKSHGCNHMTCGRCNAHFCYRCGDSISPLDPYQHFNTAGRPCFQKLFEVDSLGEPINVVLPEAEVDRTGDDFDEMDQWDMRLLVEW
ncbi:hypothetical protein IAR50_000391 [Cryptococcus sp. DSM 104548]